MNGPYESMSFSLYKRTEEPVVVPRVADEVALGEGDVEDGGVVVDELEEVDLEGEGVVVLRLRPVQLQPRQPLRHVLVYLRRNIRDFISYKSYTRYGL